METNENIQKISLSEDQKKSCRNLLFDLIIESGVSFAALIKDYEKNNLFCGQVGEVTLTVETDTCLVTFINFQNDQNEYNYGIIEKENLLPLFNYWQRENNNIKIILPIDNENVNLITSEKEYLTIPEIRDKWEELKLHSAPSLPLIKHNKIDSRFDVGRLITIQFDVKQEFKDDELKSFFIQAGEVGLISRIRRYDFVEVTFFPRVLGELAVEADKLLASTIDPEEITIKIHKNFFFPLYCEYCKAVKD